MERQRQSHLKKQGVFIDLLADCEGEEWVSEMGTACLGLWLCICIFVCICICLCLVHWCAGADCVGEEWVSEMGTACLGLWLCLCIFVCICICLCLVHWCAGADCVGEEWVCEVDSASSAPLTHPPQTSNNAQTLSNSSLSSSSLTLSLFIVQNTISHNTSPCSSPRHSAQSLSQAGGLMLPCALLYWVSPKIEFWELCWETRFFDQSGLQWVKVAQTVQDNLDVPKWSKNLVSQPASPSKFCWQLFLRHRVWIIRLTKWLLPASPCLTWQRQSH